MTALPRPGGCAVLGVLNVTPDSFSDGGRFLDRDDAVRTASPCAPRAPISSTSGGVHPTRAPTRIDAATELRRVLPVIAELVAARRAGQRRHHPGRGGAAAIDAGAVLVNDVSGGLADPAMAAVVSSARRAVGADALAGQGRRARGAMRTSSARSARSSWPASTPRCWRASTRR